MIKAILFIGSVTLCMSSFAQQSNEKATEKAAVPQEQATEKLTKPNVNSKQGQDLKKPNAAEPRTRKVHPIPSQKKTVTTVAEEALENK